MPGTLHLVNPLDMDKVEMVKQMLYKTKNVGEGVGHLRCKCTHTIGRGDHALLNYIPRPCDKT